MNLPRLRILPTAFYLAAALGTSTLASAQAYATAARSAEISPFATTTLLNPDYGPTDNLGYSAGVDFTRFLRTLVQPSLELRLTHASGPTATENSYLSGVRLAPHSIRGITPYATLLAGMGYITFTHPVSQGYLSDNSVVYGLGGGAEVNVLRSWALRADFVDQHWSLGGGSTLSPIAMSAGIAYRIPTHSNVIR